MQDFFDSWTEINGAHSFSVEIFEVTKKITDSIAYFMPRNANIEQVSYEGGTIIDKWPEVYSASAAY